MRLILIGLLLLSACSAPRKKVATEVDQLFRDQFPDQEPGAAVLIADQEGIVFSKGYGVADINTNVPVTTQTLFNVGSITKTFVANTILSLQEDHKLSVNDSLLKYFPNFKNPAIVKNIQLRHLLTHTSGLPDIRREFLDSVALLSAKDSANWAPMLSATKLNLEPGSQYEYSNPAFNALALIIEQVTHDQWQHVVGERIFKRANMPTSVITNGSFPQQGVAHAYIGKSGNYQEKDYGEEPTFAAAGNGGVWSSVEELANYEQALRQHIILPEAVIKRSRTVTTFPNWKGERPPFIGYSWFVTPSEEGQMIYSHTGTQGGFHADFVSVPDRNFLYIVLSTRSFPRAEFRRKILDLVHLHEYTSPIPN